MKDLTPEGCSGLPGSRGGDDAENPPRCLADVFFGKMGVALGRAGIGMAEQPPDGVDAPVPLLPAYSTIRLSPLSG